jgi:acetylornithine deacetylase/succinyl-diaminopimelate desuccinylase-like protein
VALLDTEARVCALTRPVALSSVTDCDGQAWVTDPFRLTEKPDGRLYGRGTCDMKGFLALALAVTPDLVASHPKKPIHLAFSYDEEVGCIGAPDMIRVIASELPRPALVVVGEPTNMEAVSGHKGISTFKVTVTGNATFIGCPGDLNNDDQVDDSDFSLFAKAYNLLVCADPAMPTGCPADLNADGFVDDVDFQIFAAAYDALLCS